MHKRERGHYGSGMVTPKDAKVCKFFLERAGKVLNFSDGQKNGQENSWTVFPPPHGVGPHWARGQCLLR